MRCASTSTGILPAACAGGKPVETVCGYGPRAHGPHRLGAQTQGKYHVALIEYAVSLPSRSKTSIFNKMLEYAYNLPARTKDYPDRDRLALRFERFKAAA